MRPRITYANTMATLALLLTLGGTAYAAVTLTSANVRNNSITGADVKSGSLTQADLHASTKRALVGPRGATGRTGSAGPKGTTGDTGPQGPRGSAAYMTSAFAYRDTGLVWQRTGTLLPNNNGGTGKHWDDPTYASSATGGPYPQIRTSGYESIPLDGSFRPVLSLTGMSGADASRSSDTRLKLTFTEAYLNATASLSILHRRNGESLATNSGGTLLHGRVQCALFYGTAADPAALTTQAGVTAVASSGYGGVDHELINVALNGNASGLVAGTEYNVTVKCRDADFTGNTQFQVARGNLTALASR